MLFGTLKVIRPVPELVQGSTMDDVCQAVVTAHKAPYRMVGKTRRNTIQIMRTRTSLGYQRRGVRRSPLVGARAQRRRSCHTLRYGQ